MKKLLNDVANLVPESLAGLGRAHADVLRIDAANLVVLRAGAPVKGKVALVSGGGSGHEPLHGGFVGLGMLDAACAGHVFTSPVPDQMEAATRAVDGGAGVLHIVKNYTGDVLNFQLAAELVAGEIEVATVVTNDDVAVQDSLYTAGRRGVGGTVLVEKIAGAKAEAGAVAGRRHRHGRQGQRERPLDGDGADLVHRARRGHAHVRPAGRRDGDRRSASTASRVVAGRSSRRPMTSPGCSSSRSSATSGSRRGEQVLAFVNGMGGTPLIELYLAYNSVAKLLDEQGIGIGRSLVGNYITSLEMAGFSVTLLRLDDELTSLWDAPVNTAALRWGV